MKKSTLMRIIGIGLIVLTLFSDANFHDFADTSNNLEVPDPVVGVTFTVLFSVGVYLVVKSRKLAGNQQTVSKSDDVNSTYSFAASVSTSDTAGGTSNEPEAEKPFDPPQNTIYAFNAKSIKRRCPFCDGEYSVGAKACDICGQDLQ